MLLNRSVQASIGVQTGDHDVDKEQIEDEHRKPGEVDPSGLLGAPATGGTGVQIAGVKDPRDEGGSLFGVPAPEATPRALGPDSAQQDAHAVDRECDHSGAIGQSVESVGMR